MAGFYSFDTSSVLNGRRDLFPPEVFPTVWENVQAMIDAGEIACVDLVRDELSRRDDETHAWLRESPGVLAELSPDVQDALRLVINRHPRLVGVGSGRSGADPWVVALAIARGGTVVTEEQATGNLTRPKIPDVCLEMGVPCLNLLGFIREQGWVFR